MKGANRLRPQDFAWLLFIAVLIATAPERSNQALIILPIIGVFQILEPRFQLFASRGGQIASIAVKMLLSYLLVGWTHGIESYYSSIFLIPVVSAATIFDLLGTMVVTAVASLVYLSFLLPIFPVDQLTPDQISLIYLRVAFFAIVAFLVYEQAKAKRDEMQRTQEAAARLAKTNRELRETQASLRRSERLAALGQLTAGLAHELRNPLGTIKASAEMLTKQAAKSRPEVMDEMAGYISSEVDRMNGLVASFLDFARPLGLHPVQADLRVALEDVVRGQAGLAQAHGVAVKIQMQDSPLTFDFDPDLLRVALTNLLQNAIQASALGQEVNMQAAASEEKVTITVSDHGSGIEPHHMESIFNPFFTTKPKGVGLGLALVAKIVDEHSGRVDVWSEPGQGTRFTVVLPREI